MRTVVVRVNDADLSGNMVEMREWLDRHGSEPTRFVYDQTDDALVVSVEFPNHGEAEAFATRFDGRELWQAVYSASSPASDIRSGSSAIVAAA